MKKMSKMVVGLVAVIILIALVACACTQCSVQNDTQNDHHNCVYGEAVISTVGTEAECTVTVHTCNECGKTEVVDKTAHKYSCNEPVVMYDKEDQDKAIGYSITYTCETCEYYYTTMLSDEQIIEYGLTPIEKLNAVHYWSTTESVATEDEYVMYLIANDLTDDVPVDEGYISRYYKVTRSCSHCDETEVVVERRDEPDPNYIPPVDDNDDKEGDKDDHNNGESDGDGNDDEEKPPVVDIPEPAPGNKECSHVYKTHTVAPTCISKGYTEYVCETCGKSYTADYVNMTKHSFGAWDVKDATCTKDGVKSHSCTVCGYTEKETINATGHKYGEWTTKDATCVTNGSKSRTCSGCGRVESETIKATGHNYGSWKTTKQPTCDTNGTKERTCSKCKHAQQETIAATGHTWDNGKVTKVPNSCEDVGIKTYTCSTCGKTRVEQMKGNHSFGEWQWEEYEYQKVDKRGKVYTRTSHRKYRLCTACGYREDVNTPDHNCKYSGEGHSEPYVLQKGNCQTKEIWATTCGICGWIGTYEKGYGDHDGVIEKRHLADYTETTNELDVEIYTCKICDLLEYNWKFGKGWVEGTDAVQHTVAPNSKMFGHNLTDYLEHPTWQTVNRDHVYDSNGKVIQYTQYWYDYEGKRHSCVVDVLAIPDMFAAAGYDIEYYKSKGIVTWHCTINPYSNKLEALRVSWVAIGG